MDGRKEEGWKEGGKKLWNEARKKVIMEERKGRWRLRGEKQGCKELKKKGSEEEMNDFRKGRNREARKETGNGRRMRFLKGKAGKKE